MSSQLKGNSRAQCLAILGQCISLCICICSSSCSSRRCWSWNWSCSCSWSGISLSRMPVPVSWHHFLFSLSYVMHLCMLAIEMLQQQQQQRQQTSSKVLPNNSRKIWFRFCCNFSFVSLFSFAYFALSTRFQQCANTFMWEFGNCLCVVLFSSCHA